MIEVKLLEALAWQHQDQTARAGQAVHKALALAEPGRFVRIFVDEGPPLARLLYETQVDHAVSDYRRQLLAAFSQERTAPRDRTSPSEPTEVLFESLSPREREVLQLIAAGLTNREIGDRLYLSLNTVKAHTRNIYGKLDVHSRTQAVALAQELGLLSSKSV